MANGKRGRRAKSIDTLKLTGQYREDRHGGLETPSPSGLPVRPRRFKGEAKKLWDAVVPELISLKLATNLDQHSLESMCEWWSTYCELRDQPIDQDPLRAGRQINSRKTAYDSFLKVAVKCGMTPVDRSGIRLKTQDKQANPFEEFLNKAQ